jgi:hypothetical protein
MLLNPHHHAWYFFILGAAYVLQERYEDAIEILDRGLIRNPDCMSSKGFGQIGSKNKRGLQVPNTFFWCVTQPLMNGYTSFVAPSYFS